MACASRLMAQVPVDTDRLSPECPRNTNIVVVLLISFRWQAEAKSRKYQRLQPVPSCRRGRACCSRPRKGTVLDTIVVETHQKGNASQLRWPTLGVPQPGWSAPQGWSPDPGGGGPRRAGYLWPITTHGDAHLGLSWNGSYERLKRTVCDNITDLSY